ncbi:polyprenyl synthetase family protein, partial [Streptomyces scabiei]
MGYNIGMAFQILDDILDYTATQDDLHKPVLEDLANGVYSLPLLLAIKKSPLVFKELLAKKTNMKLSDKQEVAALVMQYNGVE